MCCAHHVGSTFVTQLVRCKKVCAGLLQGVRNTDNGDFDKFAKKQ